MTFSLIARCPDTRMVGIATATRSFNVGARVPHAGARLGVIAVMARADARIGHYGLSLLRQGCKAHHVVDRMVANDPWPEERQLGVIDDDGNLALRTGSANAGWAGHQDHGTFATLGNVLPGETTLDAMAAGFTADPDAPFEDRLMRALEEGRDAGGQVGGQVSAALLVYGDDAFARVDLRVDQHDEPVGELRRVYDAYRPYIPYYIQRQTDPRIGGWFDWNPEAES